MVSRNCEREEVNEILRDEEGLLEKKYDSERAKNVMLGER